MSKFVNPKLDVRNQKANTSTLTKMSTQAISHPFSRNRVMRSERQSRTGSEQGHSERTEGREKATNTESTRKDEYTEAEK